MTPRILLTEQLEPFAGQIGTSAELIRLAAGEVPAEYVQSGWSYVGDESSSSQAGALEDPYRWEHSLVSHASLLWQKDAVFFDLMFLGSDTAPSFLGQEVLVCFAETLEYGLKQSISAPAVLVPGEGGARQLASR